MDGDRFEAGPMIRAGLARGVALFNRGDHWGSHEAWEGAWHVAEAQDRDFLQGLIQAAAAMHKLRVQDNPRGARILLSRALQRLEPLPPEHHGVALAALRSQLAGWQHELEAHGTTSFEGSLRGLPNIAWSAEGRAARLRVEELRVHPVAVGDHQALVLEVHAQGRRGWAECPLPWRREGTRRSIERVLGPALLAEPVAAPSALPLRWQGMAEDPFAAAALESAVWDLWARVMGWSLHQAMGLTTRRLPLAATVQGVGEVSLRADAEHLAVLGYGELVFPARPGADRRLLPRLVAAAGPRYSFDLGRAYRPADLYALQALAATSPAALLRPVPRRNLHEAIRLRRWLDVPVVTAAAHDVGDGEAQMILGATDELLIDPLRCGPTAALELAEAAAAHGLPARMRAHARTPIGAGNALAIAMHPAFTKPADLGRAPDSTDEGLAALSADWPAPEADGCLAAVPGSNASPRMNAKRDEWLAAVASGPVTRQRI
jgi:L-alanine-DL-glutamate epimerase-like enolase superfamily enzyme/predicted metal-dependent hydrolase